MRQEIRERRYLGVPARQLTRFGLCGLDSLHIKELYGVGEERCDHFARQCLSARRMVERGVRFVQIYSDGEWDAHGGLESNHRENCQATDGPIAALLADLRRRGL